MEVVGAVSSVVGIVGFTGQAIIGLLKLRQLLKDAAAAKETVNHVLETIDLLSSTLKEVERVVGIIEKLPQHQIDGQAILETGALKYQTKACAKDVTDWILVAKKLDPRSRKGIKAFLRKIKVAAGKEDLQLLGEAISSHQQRIAIGLSLLGSSLDVLGIHRLDKIDKGLGGLTEAHLKLNDLVNVNQQKTSVSKSTEESLVALLDSFLSSDKFASENASEASLHSIHESISSLASSVSELVAKLSPGQQDQVVRGFDSLPDSQTKVTPQWGCDAISGIEEAFDGDRCIYCYKLFANSGTGTDWRVRGRHLAREHRFGACNLGTTFSSWGDMKQHLSDFHDFSIKAGESFTTSITSHFLCPRRSLPLFERNAEDKTQFMKAFDEIPAAAYILSAEFATAIGNPDSLKAELHLVKACFRSRGQVFQRKVNSMIDGGTIDSILPLLWQIRQKLVYLFEELVIGEKDEMPEVPRMSPRFTDTHTGDPAIEFSILGSMLLRLSEELEEKRCRETIEPLFASNTVPNTAESLALNDRINPWLLTVLRNSSNTRVIVAKGFGAEIKDPSDIVLWMSSAIQFWFTDGTAASGGGLHLVSDGAIDSRDNLLGSPMPSLDTFQELSPLEPSNSGRPGTAMFTYGGSSEGSAASLKSDLAAKRYPSVKPVKPPMFTFAGSSSGGSVSSLNVAPQQPSVRRVVKSEEQPFDDDVFESDDEDEIDENAIDDDDDSSDWEDSGEDEMPVFSHVDSVLNLTSRRSMLATVLTPELRAKLLQERRATTKASLATSQSHEFSHRRQREPVFQAVLRRKFSTNSINQLSPTHHHHHHPILDDLRSLQRRSSA